VKFDKELLEKANFSKKAIDYILNAKNYGRIENADAIGSSIGTCMDSVMVFLKIENGKILDAKFVYSGCAGSAAAGSAVTELAKGKTLAEARKITAEDVVEFYREGDKSIPVQKRDCINIAINSLYDAIDKYLRSKKINKN